MYKVLKAETLAAKIHLMVVHAPRVASHCLPGQFIIVKLDEKGERIPLTICDYDREAGTVTIVFQEIGASTVKMSALKEGDSFRDFVGPLGCPSEFVHEDIEELKKKKMVFVAGGVGTAPVYPQVNGFMSTVSQQMLSLVPRQRIWLSLRKSFHLFPIFMLQQMTDPMAVPVW